MILQAQQELGLDLENSILIGDKGSDIQAGIAAGLGLNILFSRERPPELTSKVYAKVTALSEVIPLISTYDESL